MALALLVHCVCLFALSQAGQMYIHCAFSAGRPAGFGDGSPTSARKRKQGFCGTRANLAPLFSSVSAFPLKLPFIGFPALCSRLLPLFVCGRANYRPVNKSPSAGVLCGCGRFCFLWSCVVPASWRAFGFVCFGRRGKRSVSCSLSGSGRRPKSQ